MAEDSGREICWANGGRDITFSCLQAQCITEGHEHSSQFTSTLQTFAKSVFTHYV